MLAFSAPTAAADDLDPHWYEWLLGAPLQTVVTLVLGAVLLAVFRGMIGRALRSVVEGGVQVRRHASRLLLRTGMETPAGDPVARSRRVQRAETMASVLRSAAALVVGVLVLTALANIWGWDLAPVLASAGVAGVALGFGAQALVKDFLSGLFMLTEDQYGVGDVVDLGEASGVVESVGLRVTQVRDLQGTLWYVRNGEVLRVGNKSQGWSRALVEVQVAPEHDIARAVEHLRLAAASLGDDPDLAPLLITDADVTAFEDLSGEHVTLRVMVKTLPGKQWDVQRGLRAQIRDEFTRIGVPLALPLREVLVGPGAPQPTRPSGTDDRAEGRDQDQKSNG